MKPDKIIVIFKTHLDIGFTDLSSNVMKKYFETFIPNAIKVSKELKRLPNPINFCWTTGSWLIYEYLKRAKTDEIKQLEEAIKCGNISWHALPFTTHSEYMTKELFEYGLSLSKKLDKKFGKNTIGAKFTDVPGHTKAIVPFLANAGIEFLHIGVNGACPNPKTPPMFRWRVPSGEEIIVMYNQLYGEFSQVGSSGTYVYFAHTGNNLGVQSSSKVVKIIENLQKKYPLAEIVIGDLNDVAHAVLKIKDEFPVLTDEIGDTWIHGAGTDPRKNSEYRSLLRYTNEIEDSSIQEKVWENLLLVAEHTCGCDEKVHLHDYYNFTKSQLAKSRRKDNFKKMELSWNEQRQYIRDALNVLPDQMKKEAEERLNEYKRDFTNVSNMTDITKQNSTTIFGWKLSWNEQGEIISLKKGNYVYADKNHHLCTLLYEQFSGKDYKKYFNEYNTHKYWWAREEYTKIGMGRVAKHHYHCPAKLKSVFSYENKLVFNLDFSCDAHSRFGAPEKIEILFTFNEKSVVVDLAWKNKPANRIAEAIWIGFSPIDTNAKISKLNMLISPCEVIENGNRKLFGTDDGVYYDGSAIHSLDAAIAAFEEPSLLNFNQKIPNTENGVYFNLYNNVWGTNFPMWYDEDARFRFLIDMTV